MSSSRKSTCDSRTASASGDQRPLVAVIVESSHGSGRNILRGIARYLREHGTWRTFHEFRNTDVMFPAWLPGWAGDGIIARIENDRIARTVRDLGVPVVDVLGEVGGFDFPMVHPDDAVIAAVAAQHLLERGFRSFAFCGIQGPQWSARRRDGFRSALESEGWDTALEELAGWLDELPLPTGVMVSHDLHGQFVIEACRRRGIAVPDQMAVIGVDNDEPLCEICDPPLSSVNSDDQRVGVCNWRAG